MSYFEITCFREVIHTAEDTRGDFSAVGAELLFFLDASAARKSSTGLCPPKHEAPKRQAGVAHGLVKEPLALAQMVIISLQDPLSPDWRLMGEATVEDANNTKEISAELSMATIVDYE